MKRGPATLLRAFIVLVGAAAILLLLWEPHLEGRNAHATLFEIYFKDPFLAFAYLGSIPFFVILIQAFKALGAGASPQGALRALRLIRYNAMALVGFVAVGEIFIFLGESDDRAGGVFMGGLIALGSIIIAIGAAVIGRGLRRQPSRA